MPLPAYTDAERAQLIADILDGRHSGFLRCLGFTNTSPRRKIASVLCRMCAGTDGAERVIACTARECALHADRPYQYRRFREAMAELVKKKGRRHDIPRRGV